jgi:tRNA acetyltransferase TAN1
MKKPFTTLTTKPMLRLKKLNFFESTESVVPNMLTDFNLLATTYRGNESRARSELRYLLEQIGDPAANVAKTGISGLIVAKTALDPFEAIGKLREILKERSYEFRYMLRIMPIEKVLRTNLEQIRNVATELSPRIGEDETFRVTVEKRFTTTSSKDIIEAAAAVVKRKVNLSKPDKILLIEVLGGFTGISVAKPNEIISVLKEKIL